MAEQCNVCPPSRCVLDQASHTGPRVPRLKIGSSGNTSRWMKHESREPGGFGSQGPQPFTSPAS